MPFYIVKIWHYYDNVVEAVTGEGKIGGKYVWRHFH